MNDTQKANIEAKFIELEGALLACEKLIKHLLVHAPEEVLVDISKESLELIDSLGSVALDSYEKKRDFSRNLRFQNLLNETERIREDDQS